MVSVVGLLLGVQTGATMYQHGTLDDLLQGRYAGTATLGAVLRRGDFGVGTFDSLDGELIILEGRAYRADTTGTLSIPAKGTKVPFACVLPFRPTAEGRVRGDLAAVSASLQGQMATGRPYAIRIDARLDRVKARSVPRQAPPFAPLADVIRDHQKTFEWRDVDATLVGTYLPDYVGRINQSGFHFHMVTADRKRGGHVLELEVRDARVWLTPIRRIEVDLADQDR